MWRVYVCVWETQHECVYFRVWLTASALWTNSLTAAPDTCEFLVTSFWCDFNPIYTLIKEWNQWVKTKQFLPADSVASLPSAISCTCWSRGLWSGRKHFWKYDVITTVVQLRFYMQEQNIWANSKTVILEYPGLKGQFSQKWKIWHHLLILMFLKTHILKKGEMHRVRSDVSDTNCCRFLCLSYQCTKYSAV